MLKNERLYELRDRSAHEPSLLITALGTDIISGKVSFEISIDIYGSFETRINKNRSFETSLTLTEFLKLQFIYVKF